MAYVSLYRKYRPQSFEEIVGQRHVTQTLSNALTDDRLHHAYLFTGPRGTGKTSTARILAKAVNCVEGSTPVPCQVCDLCVAIAEGSSVDVIELDMASHGGVDDARELRERALFVPARARRKVYILDEVHMASSAAFNALLKLIEEPPPHVLFAMATTDPQKVLPTIMSRVQRLDLRRVRGDDLADHVRRVAALERFGISDDAVAAIVRAGDGSVRDSLSVFEHVAAFAGGDVDADHVAQVLGHTPAQRMFEAVALLAAGDLAGLLALVQGLLDEGHDLRRFAFDLVGHIRDLLVLQVTPQRPDLVDATVEQRARLLGQAPLLPREALVRAVDVLAETIPEMRRGPSRLPLELALAKLALPEAKDEIGALAQRMAALEALMASGAAPTTSPTRPSFAGDTPAPPGATDAETHVISPDPEPSPAPGEGSLASVLGRWSQVLDALKQRSRRLHGIYRSATPVGLDDAAIELAFSSAWHAEQGARHENAEVFASVLAELCGLKLGIRATVAPARPAPEAADDGRVPTTSQPPRLGVGERSWSRSGLGVRSGLGLPKAATGVSKTTTGSAPGRAGGPAGGEIQDRGGTNQRVGRDKFLGTDEELEASETPAAGGEELHEKEATIRAAALLRERLGAEPVEGDRKGPSRPVSSSPSSESGSDPVSMDQ